MFLFYIVVHVSIVFFVIALHFAHCIFLLVSSREKRKMSYYYVTVNVYKCFDLIFIE
jgi:hypothetical protein